MPCSSAIRHQAVRVSECHTVCSVQPHLAVPYMPPVSSHPSAEQQNESAQAVKRACELRWAEPCSSAVLSDKISINVQQKNATSARLLSLCTLSTAAQQVSGMHACHHSLQQAAGVSCVAAAGVSCAMSAPSACSLCSATSFIHSLSYCGDR